MKYVYEFTNQRRLTKTEFLRWFQKKVLYIIRKYKMISSGDIIVYENKGDFRGVVLEDALKIFAEKIDVELVSSHSPSHHLHKADKQLIKNFLVNNPRYRAKRSKIKVSIPSCLSPSKYPQ